MRICLFILFLLSFRKSDAQDFLANGSFEDRNICIEFRAGCAPEAWFRIPLVPVTIHNGPDRNHYVSIVMENMRAPVSSRNYIYTRLLCELQPGKKYRFKTLLRPDQGIFDHLDVLMVPYEPNRNKELLSTEKQKITLTPRELVKDTTGGWAEYVFEFTAKGDERYLIIGNFSKDPLPKQQEGSVTGDIAYDIDNVSLLPAGDIWAGACFDRANNKTILYRNNSRHTINNFLDDEEPFVREPEKKPEPVKDVVVAPIVNDTLVIPDVLFKLNSAELNPKFAKGLDTLITNIKGRTFKRMEVIGHTDSLGTHALNTALSLHRAETVKNYLAVKLQYPTASIAASGKAALIPVATNKTAVGRQKNRRVEIILIK